MSINSEGLKSWKVSSLAKMKVIKLESNHIIKLEISDRRKFEKTTKTWKLNNTCDRKWFWRLVPHVHKRTLQFLDVLLIHVCINLFHKYHWLPIICQCVGHWVYDEVRIGTMPNIMTIHYNKIEQLHPKLNSHQFHSCIGFPRRMWKEHRVGRGGKGVIVN